MSTSLAPQPTHLYFERWACWDGCPLGDHDCYEVVACPVTRVTTKRIYFRDGGAAKWCSECGEMFVDRAVIEKATSGARLLSEISETALRLGGVYHHGMRKVLYLDPPPARRDWRQPSKSVAELRKEAAELHPDVGGDPDEFRAAYSRYIAAKAVAE